MNNRIILKMLGKLIQLEGILLILPTMLGLYFSEKSFIYLAVTAGGSIILGSLIRLIPTKNSRIRAKEGFVITALAWLVFSAIGAIPFCISGYIPSFTDAMFETSSGFTTTGASILPNVEILPRCLLFWRSFTHWIGGMGILVFMLIFVQSSADEMNIMKAESPGPSVEKMVPKVRETALTLYAIYTTMTIILIIALIIAGMPAFDSACISFGTAGTGGFGVKADSIASYNSTCQTIITIGMVMFGINFNAYFLILIRKFKCLFKLEEVIVYLSIFFIASIIVTLGTVGESFGGSFHHASFQVASIMTTTGFATVDFNLWTTMPKGILVLVMFIGACAGSTGGGLKVSRVILYFKQVVREIQSYIHPSSVRNIRLDGKSVNRDTLRTTNVFLMAYIFIFVTSFFIISFDGFDLTTTFTSVAATINNIGPGLELVGPTGHYADYSILSKWVLIFDMIAGRLELFPVLIMFSISTWRKK